LQEERKTVRREKRNRCLIIFVIKLAIGISITLLILALVEPLVIFFVESLGNPELLKISLREVSMINSTHSSATIVIQYSGKIMLKNFRISIAGEELEIDEVVSGEYRKEVILPTTILEKSRCCDIEFMIAGIYRMKQVVRE